MTAILITHDGHTTDIDLPAGHDAQETLLYAVLRTRDVEGLFLDSGMSLWCDYAAWEAGHLDKPHNDLATALGGHDVYGAAIVTGPSDDEQATPLTDAQRTELLARIARLRANR